MGETVGSALITGATGHLGRRIAESMFQQSFTLAINDIDEKASALLAASVARRWAVMSGIVMDGCPCTRSALISTTAPLSLTPPMV